MIGEQYADGETFCPFTSVGYLRAAVDAKAAGGAGYVSQRGFEFI